MASFFRALSAAALAVAIFVPSAVSAEYVPSPSAKKAAAMVDGFVAKLRATNDDPAFLMDRLQQVKASLEKYRTAKQKARKYSGSTARLVDSLITALTVRIAGLRAEAGLPPPAPTGTPSSGTSSASTGSVSRPDSGAVSPVPSKPSGQFIGLRNATSDTKGVSYGLRARSAGTSKKFRIYDVAVYTPSNLSTPVSSDLVPAKSDAAPSFVTKYLGMNVKLYFRSVTSPEAVAKLVKELERRTMKFSSFVVDASYSARFEFASDARKNYRLYVAEDGSEAFVVDYATERP